MIIRHCHINFSGYLRPFLFLCMASAAFSGARAQHRFQMPNLLFEPRVNYGFLTAHHVEMEIYNSHFPSFEFSISQETYGKRQWESFYNYPVTGLTYWNAWLGNSKALGQAHALVPYISFPILKNDRSEVNFRLGAGLAYLTKKFDRLSNYKFNAIGSHLNAAVNLMAEYRWKPLKHLQLSAGIQLMHFSNGSTKTPNFGLNIPAVSAGAAFRLNQLNNPIRQRVRPSLTMYEFDGREFIEVKLGTIFAYKESGDTDGKKYQVYSGFLSTMKNIDYKNKLGICFDLSWDGSDALLVARTNQEPYPARQLTKPGLSAAYELVLDRTSFAFNLGFYLGGKDKSEGMSYYKLGIHYLVTKNLFANLTLKTHYARADFVGIGLGYRFKWGYYLK
ncbi:acyloxyacyl hydrolase [Lentimicrobium sp.]|uniref:acyloxyacyl hydrolase n=2 Tax=Lentimicrobium sp. TaxID=2034841 RepID=UPI00345ED803